MKALYAPTASCQGGGRTTAENFKRVAQLEVAGDRIMSPAGHCVDLARCSQPWRMRITFRCACKVPSLSKFAHVLGALRRLRIHIPSRFVALANAARFETAGCNAPIRIHRCRAQYNAASGVWL